MFHGLFCRNTKNELSKEFSRRHRVKLRRRPAARALGALLYTDDTAKKE